MCDGGGRWVGLRNRVCVLCICYHITLGELIKFIAGHQLYLWEVDVVRYLGWLSGSMAKWWVCCHWRCCCVLC